MASGRSWRDPSARYYNPATGTFNRLDPFFGNLNDPQSLHKYMYAHGDPVNGIDPSGLMFSMTMSVTIGMARTGAMAGLVIGSAYGAVRGFLDEFLARDSTWMDVFLSTISGAAWGGATGLLFGYALPFIALGGPWAVGGVIGAGALFAGYNTVQSVREAWAAGNTEQAVFRGVVGTIETVLSVFAVSRAFSLKYGPKPAAVGRSAGEGTALPGKATMGFLRMIMRRMGVNDIVEDPSLPEGGGVYNWETQTIRIHPNSGFSVLVHEMMHGLHHRYLRSIGVNWQTIPESGPAGREQAAFALVYKIFGRFMTASEIKAHADYLSAWPICGDPSLVAPNL